MSDEPKTPRGEHAWVGYYNSNGDLLFIITSKNNNRDLYYLYENRSGEFVKLGKDKDPLKLCDKFKVYDKIHDGRQASD